MKSLDKSPKLSEERRKLQEEFINKISVLALKFGYKSEIDNFKKAKELIELQIVPNPSRRDLVKNLLAGVVTGAAFGYSIDIMMNAKTTAKDVVPPGKATEFMSVAFACIAFWLNPQNEECGDEEFRKILLKELLGRKLVSGDNMEDKVEEFLKEIKEVHEVYKKAVGRKI